MSLLSRFKTIETFKLIDSPNQVIIEGESMKKLQNILLEALRDILTVCKENEIQITMGGGSCLGAVRHKGFIPWDDDIDLNITREGYEKFLPLFLDRFGQKYWVLDANRTKDYPVICPQVRRKGTVVRNRDDFKKDECGACIDLCIIEDIPNNSFLRAIQGVASLALGLMASCRRFYQHKEDYLRIAADNEDAVRAVKTKSLIGSLLFFTSYGKLNRLWDKCNSLYRNCNSKYVSVPGGRLRYFGERYLRTALFPAKSGVFEGMEVPLPRDVDGYLAHLYGPDYMTLPPKEKREKHAVVEFKVE